MNEKAIEALNSVVAYAGTYHAKINNDYGIIRLALTELAEIKRRAEEILSPTVSGHAYTSEVINYILKGETK